jgi:hypothetical protein
MTSVHVFVSQMIGEDVPIVAIRSGRFCSQAYQCSETGK